MSNTLNELYAKKGQIVTTQELLQGQLNAVNKGINEELNKGITPPPLPEKTQAEKIKEEKRRRKEEEKNKKRENKKEKKKRGSK